MTRIRPIAALIPLLLLAACGAGSEPEPGSPAAEARAPAAPRAPAAGTAQDSRGIVTYRDYAAVVARQDDTLEAMAARVDLPASELAAYNGLPASYRPRAGDELVLPPRPGGYGSARPAPAAPEPAGQAAAPLSEPLSPSAPASSDDGWSPARVNEALARADGAAPRPPEPTSGAGYAEVGYHEVREGETVYSIARAYGVPAERLIAWNALSGPTYGVSAGQVLTIPSAAAQPPEAARAVAVPGAGDMAAPPPTAGAPLPPDTVAPRPLASPQLERFQTPVPDPAAQAEAEPTETAALEPDPAPEPAPTAAAAPAAPVGKLLRPVPGRVAIPYNRDGAGAARNDGVDFAAQPGEPVRAAAPGTVALISSSLGEWGTIVLVRHDERLMTVYGRLGAVNVERGARVEAGQVIGEVAAPESGQALMHFEVRRGAFSENPEDFL